VISICRDEVALPLSGKEWGIGPFRIAMAPIPSARLREHRLGRAAVGDMRLYVVLADDARRRPGAEFDEIARLLAAVGQNRDDAVNALRRSRHEDRRMQSDILPDRKEMTRQKITGSARDILQYRDEMLGYKSARVESRRTAAPCGEE
jgi:hypothetical protein